MRSRLQTRREIIPDIKIWANMWWLDFVPVFGTSWAHLFHICCGLCTVVYFAWQSTQDFPELDSALDRCNAPALLYHCRYGIVAYMLSICCRMMLSRQVVVSPELQELYSDCCGIGRYHAIRDIEFDVTMEEKDETNIGNIKDHFRRDCHLCVVWPVSALFLGCVCVKLEWITSTVYLELVVPLALGMLANGYTFLATRLATLLAEHQINRFDLQLQQTVESNYLPDGFWRLKIEQYLDLDACIKQLFCQVANPVAIHIAALLANSWFFATAAVSAKHSGLKILLCCVVASFAGFSILMMYPMAHVTERSLSTVSTEPSMIMWVQKCGHLDMDQKARMEYNSFAAIMQSCPLGIKLPLLGTVTSSDLMAAAKLIATFLPLAITYSLTADVPSVRPH